VLGGERRGVEGGVGGAVGVGAEVPEGTGEPEPTEPTTARVMAATANTRAVSTAGLTMALQ
jgi:hypothetical protein